MSWLVWFLIESDGENFSHVAACVNGFLELTGGEGCPLANSRIASSSVSFYREGANENLH
jgi:hypothetical protein